MGSFKEKGLDHQVSSIDVTISTSGVSVPNYVAQTKRREREINETGDDDVKCCVL